MSMSYKDLIVWQKAMDLVVEIYRASESNPKSEMFGLTQQMRRAAVSIPSNIAEGQAQRRRRTTSISCIWLGDPCKNSRRRPSLPIASVT